MVATPIGNLEDITLRALRVLREVQVIACEDTRRTAKLLAHHHIPKPEMISHYQGNETRSTARLLEKLAGGLDVALVCDAGTPGVSDPGYRLVSAAVEQGFEVIPVPGPSALLAGLSVSGLATDSFVFQGFLPRKKGHRTEKLRELAEQPRTVVIYESVHRIRKTLSEMAEVFGQRRAVLCRELTKIHEQVIRSDLKQLAHMEFPQKGEFLLIVEGLQ